MKRHLLSPPPGAAAGRALTWVHALNQSHGYGSGTLAAVLRPVARPELLLGLTAGHVVSEDEQARVGDPCALRNSAGSAVAGRLFDWFPYFRAVDRSVTMDAGLIELPAQTLEPLVEDLAWPLGWADVQPGDDLRVLTRQHRLAGRMVRTAHVVPMQVGLANLRYEILDAALFDIDDPLEPGDSGAAVWNLNDELVGVLSGLAPDDAGANAVMTPIRRILEWAQADVVLRHQALLGEDRSAPRPSPMAVAVAVAPALLASAPPADSLAAAAVQTLARTMWGEARGDGRAGMWAVGQVVLNRVIDARWWGHDVESVCLRPFQFSCWNTGDPNLPQMLRVTLADSAFCVARELATALLARPANDPQRVRDDPTHGATHYFSKQLPRWPEWAANRQPVAEIGHHLFFKGVG